MSKKYEKIHKRYNKPMCISHRCVRVMMFLIVFRASKLMELMEWCVILITPFYPIGDWVLCDCRVSYQRFVF